MKKTVLILILGLQFSACNEKEDARPYCSPGLITVIFDGRTYINSAFDLVNELDMQIVDISGYCYKLYLPADSAEYVWHLLTSKTYIDTSFKELNLIYDTTGGRFIVIPFFRDMPVQNQADWLSFAQENQLIAVLDSFGIPGPQVATVRVPEGHERYWIAVFEQYTDLVRVAELETCFELF